MMSSSDRKESRTFDLDAAPPEVQWWYQNLRKTHRCLLVLGCLQCIISVYIGSRFYFGLVVSYIVGAMGALSALLSLASTLGLSMLEEGIQHPMVAFTVNQDVGMILLVTAIAFSASLVSLRAIFETHLRAHTYEHSSFEAEISHTDTLVSIVSTLSFGVVACMLVLLMGITHIQRAMRKQKCLNEALHDHVYLRTIVVTGLVGALLIGRATYGIHRLESEALSFKELAVSRGLGAMLFVASLFGLTGFKLRVLGYIFAATLPPMAGVMI